MAVGHNAFVNVVPKTMTGVFANLPPLVIGNGIVAGDRYISTDEGLIYTAVPSIVSPTTILFWMAPGDWQAISDGAVQQYFGVAVSAVGKINEVAAAGGACVGICQFASLDAAAIVVRSHGISTMIAGEQVTAGDDVACFDTGKGRKTPNKLVQATGAGASLVGYALTTAAADTNPFRVALTLGGVVPTTYA